MNKTIYDRQRSDGPDDGPPPSGHPQVPLSEAYRRFLAGIRTMKGVKLSAMIVFDGMNRVMVRVS